MVNASAVTSLNEGREAVEIPLPISMHTGQIILQTKLLTATDLHFYDFEGHVPAQRGVVNRPARPKRPGGGE